MRKIKNVEKALTSLSQYKFVKPFILFITCFIFYGNTIPNNYALDDGLVINENQFTKSGIAGIPLIFKYDSFAGCLGVGSDANLVAGGRYRPLSLVTFAMEYQIFGENPHVNHLINILLLVLAVIILYLLLSKIYTTSPHQHTFFDLPFVTGLLFITHPVHTEVIANIKGRDEIMAMIGSLSAILCTLKYIDTKHYKYLIFSFISLFLALLSKENAITFLAIIPLSIYFYKRERWIQYLLSLIPACLATIIFLVIRRLALGAVVPVPDELLNNPYIYATFSQKFATIFYTLGLYVKLLFWPVPLTYDYNPYHIKLISWNNMFAVGSLLFYLALGIYALLKARKKPVISFGILFYLITLSIVSNLFLPIGTFMSERFLFIPSIGILLIIAWFLTVKIPKLKNIRIPLLTFILVLFFIKTYSRNLVWCDNVSLFTTDVKTSSDGIKSNMFAGRIYLYMAAKAVDSSLKKEYLGNALRYSRKAAYICPNHVDVVTVMAEAFTANNLPDSALVCYKRAIYLMPEREEIFSKCATEILNKTNDTDVKIENYLSFIKLAPRNFAFNYQLGNLLAERKHDFVRSCYYLQRSVEIMPGDYAVNMILGINYRVLKDYDRSSFYLEKAAELSPEYLPVYKNLLITYKLSGNTGRAQAVLKKIKELESK